MVKSGETATRLTRVICQDVVAIVQQRVHVTMRWTDAITHAESVVGYRTRTIIDVVVSQVRNAGTKMA